MLIIAVSLINVNNCLLINQSEYTYADANSSDDIMIDDNQDNIQDESEGSIIYTQVTAMTKQARITSYNVCYTKLLRICRRVC